MNKHEFLLKIKRQPVQVDIAGLGAVHMLPLSGKDRQEFAKDAQNGAISDTKWLARVLVDSDGNRLFKDTDIDELADGNGQMLQDLAMKMLEVSGFGQQAVDEAKKD